MSVDKLHITRLDTRDADFDNSLKGMLNRAILGNPELNRLVEGILTDVRERGDSAVLDYTRRFDRFEATSMAALTVSREQMEISLQRLPAVQASALKAAAVRIRDYHEKQKQGSWQYQEADGSIYGQKVMPLDRVGIYVPGGKANYPSSMLMNAIPAQVAGVKEIIAVVPTPWSEAGDLVFAAAALAGVQTLFTIGGAQAVGALAFGTQSVPKVDKITGPGNIYVTIAKKQVFGEVGIDMIAGPSELTIICDGETNPDWIAMDLFSQAEHDEQAQSILISDNAAFLDAVMASIERLLPAMTRREIIGKSLKSRGIFIKTRSLQEAATVSDLIAPEHLELSVADPQGLAEYITHAGALFMGRYSAEALGDYCAGPSHVLPTSGTARFFSALGVYDFQKRTSIIQCSAQGASSLAGIASELATNEFLQAHAESAAYRK
ncbi:MAG: histidinol dehydrogenase [Gammaproteobacteria bacterium]|nr:histidinol dehydrogenase [Gammaproteobacteria bacterium]MDP2140209.1 histidinol dehydrogenase [Gammaproteobacteria bacterium]MDP2348085.1 histidinol dehydrogenase [Gammaproteobacteria bacterium]